jgi:D-glycero-D-manno-heptose 1,7-bisphosphate phosphatase
MSRRAVFLDRDGVVNKPVIRDGKPYPPSSPSDVVMVPSVRESLLRLQQLDFLLFIVTNQPDVKRGGVLRADVERIHSWLAAQLPITDWFTCFHDDDDHCACRKPQPGLLIEAATKYAVDLKTSYMIGDRWRDIDAGHAAGCYTILIDYGYEERAPDAAPEAIVRSLPDAANWIWAVERRNQS